MFDIFLTSFLHTFICFYMLLTYVLCVFNVFGGGVWGMFGVCVGYVLGVFCCVLTHKTKYKNIKNI